jgi:hypothetical protein
LDQAVRETVSLVMPKKRFSAEQIVKLLRRRRSGPPSKQLLMCYGPEMTVKIVRHWLASLGTRTIEPGSPGKNGFNGKRATIC